MGLPLKCCTRCGKEFPSSPDYFHKDSTRQDGLYPQCKPCRKEKARKYFLENSERVLQKGAEWKRENPDKVAAQVKKWAKDHPERRKATAERFLENNPDKNTEYMRRWRENHREQYREIDRGYRERTRERQRENAQRNREKDRERYRNYQRNRLAQKQANGSVLTVEDIQQQYERQQGLCYWCSRNVGQTYHVDHVIPIIRGGSNSPENVVIACPSCNQRKSDKIPYTEWTPPNPLYGC